MFAKTIKMPTFAALQTTKGNSNKELRFRSSAGRAIHF